MKNRKIKRYQGKKGMLKGGMSIPLMILLLLAIVVGLALINGLEIKDPPKIKKGTPLPDPKSIQNISN